MYRLFQAGLVAACAQLLAGFTTVGFVILALRLPSEVLPMPDDQMETSGLLAIIWSGLMSIGVASFGANTYAAWKAIRG